MPGLLDYLGYAGNLLDLPGSSVRDLLSGRNPFDQWMTPFSDENRASGRDVLQPLLGANEETGVSGWLDNPMEGFKDVAGFGAEMLLDPLNFVSGAGVMRALKGAKAARGKNAAIAAENVANAGRYGYVNPKVAARQMDEIVNPISGDTVRLYRGQSTSPPGNVSDWLKDAMETDPYLKDSVAAEGGWAAYSPEEASWYVNHAKDATGQAEMVYQDVPRSVAEASRVTNLPDNIRKFSRRPEAEAFLPPEYRKGWKSVSARQMEEIVNPISGEAPQRLLGYDPSVGDIKSKLDAAAAGRLRRDEFFNKNIMERPENIPWEELSPAYDELDKIDAELRMIDPTLGDRVSEFYSKPIVGSTYDDWMGEVVGKNTALRNILGGLDMSQPDNQMVLNNLASAFDDSARNPFAEDGPLMATMRQFAGDVADVDSQLVDPLYSLTHNEKFMNLVKQAAVDVGEKVDNRFEDLLPELFHEGPARRQIRMFKRMREDLPAVIDATDSSDPTRHYLEQVLNVANIFDNPVKAAKFEYDRQLAKISGGRPKNPTTLVTQEAVPARRQVSNQELIEAMNPMKKDKVNVPSVATPATAMVLQNILARQQSAGGSL
jgi:hypothetical protein